MTQTVQQFAAAMAAAFETRTRSNGDRYVCLRDGSPQEFTDVIFAAHGSGALLPDDWTYEAVRDAVEILADGGDEERADDWQADVSTANLLDWLKADMNRLADVEDVIHDTGMSALGLAGSIMEAQCNAFREIFSTVARAIEEATADAEEDEDEEHYASQQVCD